jgi:hypothetical protein
LKNFLLKGMMNHQAMQAGYINMHMTSVGIPPRLQNETLICDVKKKDNHEDP